MNSELYYEECGSGFPLILLHGNGEDHTYFVHQADYFGNRYRVIALDTRGHGRSPRGDGEFSIERFADDLYDFLTAHGIARRICSAFRMAEILHLHSLLNIPIWSAVLFLTAQT